MWYEEKYMQIEYEEKWFSIRPEQFNIHAASASTIEGS